MTGTNAPDDDIGSLDDATLRHLLRVARIELEAAQSHCENTKQKLFKALEKAAAHEENIKELKSQISKLTSSGPAANTVQEKSQYQDIEVMIGFPTKVVGENAAAQTEKEATRKTDILEAKPNMDVHRSDGLLSLMEVDQAKGPVMKRKHEESPTREVKKPKPTSTRIVTCEECREHGYECENKWPCRRCVQDKRFCHRLKCNKMFGKGRCMEDSCKRAHADDDVGGIMNRKEAEISKKYWAPS